MPSILATLARRARWPPLLAALGAPCRRRPACSGAYLAAMQADFRDDYAEAARLLRPGAALDPENVGLLTNAVVAEVAMGDVAERAPLADRLEAADPGNQVATLVRLGDTLATGDFAAAADDARRGRRHGEPAARRAVAGWIEVGRDDFAAAQAQVRRA